MGGLTPRGAEGEQGGGPGVVGELGGDECGQGSPERVPRDHDAEVGEQRPQSQQLLLDRRVNQRGGRGEAVVDLTALAQPVGAQTEVEVAEPVLDVGGPPEDDEDPSRRGQAAHEAMGVSPSFEQW